MIHFKKYGNTIVFENEGYIILVPFWAVWPFETMIIPKNHSTNIGDMKNKRKSSFADAIKKLTTAYNSVFNIIFPYSAGIHQSPTDSEKHDEWHLHMHFYPPLLRSASIKKFMVGYEMLAEPQRDVTPEASAESLQTLAKLIPNLNQ